MRLQALLDRHTSWLEMNPHQYEHRHMSACHLIYIHTLYACSLICKQNSEKKKEDQWRRQVGKMMHHMAWSPFASLLPQRYTTPVAIRPTQINIRESIAIRAKASTDRYLLCPLVSVLCVFLKAKCSLPVASCNGVCSGHRHHHRSRARPHPC